MCRLAAYSGPALPLKSLLSDPDHSLLKQSWGPREMAEAALNADGFGFGWYDADGRPAIYTNTCPMWSDGNLDALGRTLRAPLWLANVRSATPGQDLSHANTQPFADGRVMFLHNGFIKGFHDGRRMHFHAWLKPEIQAGIRGNTDSEYIFAVYRQCLAGTDGDLRAALLATIAVLPELIRDTACLLNIVVSDGAAMVFCRHAFNGGECPTLYVTEHDPAFPDSVIVASESFSNGGDWRMQAPHSIAVVRGSRVRENTAL